MAENVGIKDLKEFVLFIASLLVSTDEALKDGWQWWKDIIKILPSFVEAPAAIDGIGNIPNELDDLDENERGEIVTALQDKLTLSDEKAIRVANQSFRVVIEIAKLAVEIKE
jgi:hypothetical protein